MPLYEYQCVDCPATDQRLAGIDNLTALCVDCGGLMLRRDDPFDRRTLDLPLNHPRKEAAP
jgi:hypothetical protein